MLPLVGLVVYACSGNFEEGSTFVSVLAAGTMAAAAAGAVGALLGFLFALPRTLDRSESAAAVLATNSNLDQVSDWITKILIGIGLVELGALADGVGDIAADVAVALGGAPAAEPLAVSLLIYSVVDGFLLGYLWTRTVLSLHLKAAAEDLARASEIAEAIAVTPVPAPPPPPAPPPRPPGPPAPPPTDPITGPVASEGQSAADGAEDLETPPSEE